MAEGLAQAALHPDEISQFLPTTPSSAASVPILEVLEKIRADKKFGDAIKFQDENKLKILVENAADPVKKYLELWNVDATAEDIKTKQKELFEAIVFLYAAATRPGKPVKLDFFLMHALTSSLHVHVMLQHFSLVQQALLLKAHFVVTILHYILSGRPKVYIENFKSYETAMPAIPNRWVDAIQFAVSTCDTHALKVVRALLQAESLYGNCDGIFLKAAQITVDRVTQVNPDDPLENRTFEVRGGVGWDEVWETQSW